MKRLINKFFIYLCVVCLILSLSPMLCSAKAGSYFMQLGKIKVGDKFDVVMSISLSQSDPAIKSFSGELRYTDHLCSFESAEGVETSVSGNIVKVEKQYTEAVRKVLVKFTFTAIKEGKAEFYFENGKYNETNEIIRSSVGYDINKVVEQIGLKSITLNEAELLPAFSTDITSYTATVENNVEKISVDAKALSETATVDGNGNHSLSVGENKIKIIVSEADGQKKTYTVNVTRKSTEPQDEKIDPLKPTINGKNYVVEKDISAFPLPYGFIAAKTKLGEEEVGILADEDLRYELFYLTEQESGTSSLYTLNSNGNFEPLCYIDIDGKYYIIEEPLFGKVAPKGYYETTVSEETGTFKAYAYEDENAADIYLVYCYFGGESKYYRFDKLERNIQRAPDFELDEVYDTNIQIDNHKDNKVGLKNPQKIGKIVLVCAIALAVCLIALIVLFIIKLKSSMSCLPPDVGSGMGNYSDSNGFSFEDDSEK